MGKRVRWLLAIVLPAAIVLGLWGWAGDREQLVGPPVLQPLEGLADLARTFPEAGDEPFVWPRDHGTKPDQFAESWLFAGMLDDQDGRQYGFQLAFFRVSVQADASGGGSAWRTRSVYRARLAVEPADQPARSRERLSRDALELAGAAAAPPRAWVEDWSFEASDSGDEFFLRAAEAEIGLELHLMGSDTQPIGVEGPAFRGYWWPGFSVKGMLRLDGNSIPVTGEAMMDRLWGRALPAGQGQLALARLWLVDTSGRAFRCEQLRRRAGGGTPLTECHVYPGELPDPGWEPADGGWRTVDGIRFPIRWALAADAGEALQTAPLSSHHAVLLDGSWSGIVVVRGREQAWGLLELSNFTAP